MSLEKGTLQKRLSIYHVCPKYLTVRFCSVLSQNDLALHKDFEKMRVTLRDWERGIVHCELI